MLSYLLEIYTYYLLSGNRNFDGESARENVVLSESQAQTLDGEKRNVVSEENLLRNWDGPNLTPLNTSKLTADQMGLQEMERQLKSFDKVFLKICCFSETLGACKFEVSIEWALICLGKTRNYQNHIFRKVHCLSFANKPSFIWA